jgi:transcriptional regulator with GAF, ATPase, and Fis domain
VDLILEHPSSLYEPPKRLTARRRRMPGTFAESAMLATSSASLPEPGRDPTPGEGAEADRGFEGMLGQSAIMREVYELIRRVAATQATVLLTGETGTGKELVARALHRLSSRSTGPFVRVNCGALSESLLESELFGHVKGAFTSAIENRRGRFEAADGGTIFLDEINSVSYKLQVKLLRVLQEHEFERVGDTHTNQVDCRIIAATNRDLLEEIEAGRFREDLFYRLNVVPIYLPPLIDRREDVASLVQYFASSYAASNQRSVPAIPRETLTALEDYAWPGNVRELQNYVERAIVLAPGDSLTLDLFPPQVRGLAPVRVGRERRTDTESLCRELAARGMTDTEGSGTDAYYYVVGLIEKTLIQHVLTACQGVQAKAAARLGINRNTLYKKIREHGLDETELL